MNSVTSYIPTLFIGFVIGFLLGYSIICPIATIPDYLLTLHEIEKDNISQTLKG